MKQSIHKIDEWVHSQVPAVHQLLPRAHRCNGVLGTKEEAPTRILLLARSGWGLNQCWLLCNIRLILVYILMIQCGAVITRSIFSNQYPCNVCCKFEVWFALCHYHRSAEKLDLVIMTLDCTKNIERLTVHTIVSWPDPIQLQTSDLMMIIR